MVSDDIYKQYCDKMTEIGNNSPIYETESIFSIYKMNRRILHLERNNGDEKELDLCKEAFIKMIDAIKLKDNPPEKIYLWPQGKMPKMLTKDNSASQLPIDPEEEPYMYALDFPKGRNPKGAVICVAGGNQGRTVPAEGLATALKLTEQGYQCFVIHNRVNLLKFPERISLNDKDSGGDIARAIRYVRANAEKYHIDPNRIAAAGFSNGGITIEHCIEFYSGKQTVKDHFPEYQPDQLDNYYGSPDVFLCIYGPRFRNFPFDYSKVIYPPTFYAVGRNDNAMDNLRYTVAKQQEAGVEIEVHTFANTPHGVAGYDVIYGRNDYPNFNNWALLADCFMQDVYNRKGK